MSKYPSVWFFKDTDCQVAIVAMETMQLVLSQFKNFNVVNWELNKPLSTKNT